MLRALAWLIKTGFFIILVLVIGNSVRFGNRTINDRIQTGIAHSERSAIGHQIKGWIKQITEDAHKGAEMLQVNGSSLRKMNNGAIPKTRTGAIPQSSASTESEERPAEEIPPSERQKLKALIRELNTTSSHDSNQRHLNQN